MGHPTNGTALATTNSDAAIMEQVVATGNLAALSPEQRVNYYRSVCDSLGLNPLTQPFQYITLNGKLTLYARKDATDQLRSIKGISIDKPDIRFEDDWIIVTVVAQDAAGRRDSDIGVLSRKDMRGDFGNALMKAVTKAKRRVTLSICGLGMLDETEIETIPTARPVVVDTETGEIVESTATVQPPAPAPTNGSAEAKPVKAEIKTPDFGRRTTELLEKLEGAGVGHEYRTKSGAIDWNHIQYSVGKLKFDKITPDNLDAIMAALEARIMEKSGESR